MTATDILNKVSTIKGENPNDPNYQRNLSTVGGSFIGLAAGAFYGYSRKKPILVCSLIGAIGGGIISRLFMPN